MVSFHWKHPMVATADYDNIVSGWIMGNLDVVGNILYCPFCWIIYPFLIQTEQLICQIFLVILSDEGSSKSH